MMKKKKNNENEKTTNGMLLMTKGYAFWGRQKNFIDKLIKKKKAINLNGNNRGFRDSKFNLKLREN